MAIDRIIASGLARPLPAMSGAEPWMGSYKPLPFASSEAEGNMPIDPVSIEASSERMSPNRLPVTITSNCLGFLTSCMAQLSTSMWESATSGYSGAISSARSRHSCDVSSTFILSTEQRRLPRARGPESGVQDAADLRLGVMHG